MNSSLIQGKIRKQLILLAAPLLIGNVLQQLYNVIDAVIVGAFVGQSAFAAVGVAGSVMNLFIFLISGSCAGVGVLFSQYYGAGDRAGFRKVFFLTTVAGVAVTISLSVIALLVLQPMLAFLNTPIEIVPYATEYLRYIYMGLLSCFVFQLLSSVLRCVGDTRSSLCFLALSMVLDLMLDVWFVMVLRLGTAGAALATVIAQIVSAVLCIGYMFRKYPQLVFRRTDLEPDISLLRTIAQFSLVSALKMCSLYIGKLLVQGTVNALGTDAITAYTAATRIEEFANSFGDSGNTSMSIFVGQNTGAGEKQRVKDGYWIGQRMLACLGIVMPILMIVFAVPALKLVLPGGNGAELTYAVGYLRTVACFYLFNFLGSGLSGYFHGRGRVNLPVAGTTIHITLRVILAKCLAHMLGLKAIAVASGIGWITVVMFWTVFRRKDFESPGTD